MELTFTALPSILYDQERAKIEGSAVYAYLIEILTFTRA